MASTPVDQESVQRERSVVQRILSKREFGVVIAVFGLLFFGMLVNPGVFLSLGNIVGVIRNAAVVTIIGFGMTLLITAGEFDLSVGSVMAVAAALTATMITSGGFPIELTLAIILVLSVLYGLFQGILVTKLGLPSLIVTIGTLTLLRGGALITLGSVTATVSAEETPLVLKSLGSVLQLPFPILIPYTDVQLFSIPAITYQVPFVHSSVQTFDSFPLQILWVLILGVIFHYILFYTRFGYRTQTTGGNEQSSRYAGVKTDQVKMMNFALVAVLAAFAGIGQLAFTGNVSPLTGDGQELVVIAAVVIGGTNLFGGEGTIGGTFLGALVFAFTQNILVLAGFGTQLFAVFTGLFIIFAVAVDAITRRARYEKLWDMYLDPIREVLTSSRTFYENVDENVQGLDAPLAFVGLLIASISVPALLVVLLTVVGDGLLDEEFKLFIVESNVEAVGMVPLTVTVGIATAVLLTTVFAHISVRALGGRGTIDKTFQAVSYSSAPLLLAWLPFVLAGFQFIDAVVGAVTLVLALGTGYLLVSGLGVLHDLDTREAIGAVLGTGVLWVLSLWWVLGQI
ncbi:YIP1 family protein [Halomicroarcula sp. GCM10025817]|uniref:ABC transporter permease subunit n=1 Tax=Haloarcula TaxID=2237 RepID=UPI0023E8C3EF|nr:YIP1 family protein [Halomicroarcula sp. SYNS111]